MNDKELLNDIFSMLKSLFDCISTYGIKSNNSNINELVNTSIKTYKNVYDYIIKNYSLLDKSVLDDLKKIPLTSFVDITSGDLLEAKEMLDGYYSFLFDFCSDIEKCRSNFEQLTSFIRNDFLKKRIEKEFEDICNDKFVFSDINNLGEFEVSFEDSFKYHIHDEKIDLENENFKDKKYFLSKILVGEFQDLNTRIYKYYGFHNYNLLEIFFFFGSRKQILNFINLSKLIIYSFDNSVIKILIRKNTIPYLDLFAICLKNIEIFPEYGCLDKWYYDSIIDDFERCTESKYKLKKMISLLFITDSPIYTYYYKVEVDFFQLKELMFKQIINLKGISEYNLQNLKMLHYQLNSFYFNLLKENTINKLKKLTK